MILSIVRATSNGASPTEGSSISKSRGADINARPAPASVAYRPIDPTNCFRRSASRGNTSKQNSRFCLIAGRANLRNAPISRFSVTVSRGNNRRPSGTNADAEIDDILGRHADKFVRAPSIVAAIEPAVGRTIPMIHFINVDLPLPLVPSRATVSLSATDSETSYRMRTAP